MNNLTLTEVAELQKVYSQLFLEGHVDDRTYKAVCIATALHILGVSSVLLEIIPNDMNLLTGLSENLRKIREELKGETDG